MSNGAAFQALADAQSSIATAFSEISVVINLIQNDINALIQELGPLNDAWVAADNDDGEEKEAFFEVWNRVRDLADRRNRLDAIRRSLYQAEQELIAAMAGS